MDSSFVLFLARRSLEVSLMVSAPILVTCLVVGTAITLIQAVTALRDMTLTVVPKLMAVGVVTLVFGHWMLGELLSFFNEIFAYMQNIGH